MQRNDRNTAKIFMSSSCKIIAEIKIYNITISETFFHTWYKGIMVVDSDSENQNGTCAIYIYGGLKQHNRLF